MKVFVAQPITEFLDEHGRLNLAYRETMEQIFAVIEGHGHEVASALLREQWGEVQMAAGAYVSDDLRLIRESDSVVAFLFGQLSFGVLVEIGYAMGIDRPVLLFFRGDVRYSEFLDGLQYAQPVSTFRFENNSELADLVISAVDALNRSST